MSDESAAEQIAREQKRRHAHNVDEHTPRCRECGSFVSKPEPENGQVRYHCGSCDRWLLEYHAPKTSATSD